MSDLTTSLVIVVVLVAVAAYLRLRARRSTKIQPTLRRRVRAKRLQLIENRRRRDAATGARANASIEGTAGEAEEGSDGGDLGNRDNRH